VTAHALLTIIASGLTEPYNTVSANRMNLLNESFILLTTYHLYSFTDFMTDIEYRNYMGISLIVVTVTSILINIGIVVISTLSLGLRKLKLRYLKYKQDKRIQER